MTKDNTLSMAEQADKYLKKVALGTFCIAIAFIFRAGKMLVEPDLAFYFQAGQMFFGFSVLLFLMPATLKFIKLRAENQACKEEDGYISQMFQKAGFHAFQFTFLFLTAIDVFAVDFFEAHSVELLLRIAVAGLLGSFSISFYRLVHINDDDDDLEESIQA